MDMVYIATQYLGAASTHLPLLLVLLPQHKVQLAGPVRKVESVKIAQHLRSSEVVFEEAVGGISWNIQAQLQVANKVQTSFPKKE